VSVGLNGKGDAGRVAVAATFGRAPVEVRISPGQRLRPWRVAAAGQLDLHVVVDGVNERYVVTLDSAESDASAMEH
jgi:hypothetical protein